MKRIKIQFVRQDPEFGQVLLNNQEVLPFHYLFPNKLDRGLNETGYLVWDDDLPKYHTAARQHGAEVITL